MADFIPGPTEATFYLGAHQPSWLSTARVPLFVSHRRLRDRRTLPEVRTNWALDSGGFTELSMHGHWKTTPSDYVRAVARYDRHHTLDWAAPQDWMCEPFMLDRTGLTVREHQQRTVDNFATLSALWFEYADNSQQSVPFMPVLQGWTLDDYWACVDLYAAAGIRLAEYPLVGIGSVCRRQATSEIGRIVRSLGSVLPLHGFGVKTSGLAAYGRWLSSADSMAWSARGRRVTGCSDTHKSEANCQRFALEWRDRVLDRLREPSQLATVVPARAA